MKESIDTLKDSDWIKHSNNKGKASILNQYFTSVFTEENIESIPTIAEKGDLQSTLTDINLNEENIIRLLESVNTAKSKGSDNIHPKFLVETAKTIVTPLSIIYRKLLDEGILPKEWKSANISAFHKKGSKSDPSNYRPISLTSVVCKTLEKIIRNSIMEHMETNNLFSQHQHGFRKGRSCVTQLLEVLDKWTEEIDSKHSLDTIYLDFRKAFDTVPHIRLINKLKSYIFKGKYLSGLQIF